MTPESHVVVYDCSDHGVFSAPRLWWTLRLCGHDGVSVLDGGLRAWSAAGLTMETGAPTPALVRGARWPKGGRRRGRGRVRGEEQGGWYGNGLVCSSLFVGLGAASGQLECE